MFGWPLTQLPEALPLSHEWTSMGSSVLDMDPLITPVECHTPMTICTGQVQSSGLAFTFNKPAATDSKQRGQGHRFYLFFILHRKDWRPDLCRVVALAVLFGLGVAVCPTCTAATTH